MTAGTATHWVVRRGSREQAGIARGLWALAEVSRELPPPLVPGDRHDDGPEEAQSPHRHTYRGRPETPVVS